MPMVKKETWYVLAAFGVLLLAALLLQRQRAQTAAAIEPTPRPLILAVDPTLVTALTVADNTGARVELALAGENLWELTEPATPAEQVDQFTVQSALGLLRQFNEHAPLETLTDLSGVGLEVPVYTITIHYADGSQQELYVGQKTFNNGAYYVRLPGQPAQLANVFTMDVLLDLLRTPPILAEGGAP